MFAIASYYDLKEREISDKLWVVFSIIGVSFLIYDFFSEFVLQNLLMVLLSVGITAGMSYALYHFGFFGGADAKALIAVAIVLPLTFEVITSHPFTAIMVLTNSVLLSLSLAFVYAIRNLVMIAKGEKIFAGLSETKIRKIMSIFLGYRVKSIGKNKFLFNMEEKKDGKRKFRFSLIKDDEDFAQENDVWITPAIPYLLFLAGGLFVTLFVGDGFTIIINGILSIF